MEKINGNHYGSSVYFEALHYADTAMTFCEIKEDAVECGHSPDRVDEIARCTIDILAERARENELKGESS